jgi:hypothetical protein
MVAGLATLTVSTPAIPLPLSVSTMFVSATEFVLIVEFVWTGEFEIAGGFVVTVALLLEAVSSEFLREHDN